MSDRLTNLFFTILGGIIVAGISYFFFSSPLPSNERLRVVHQVLNVDGFSSVLDQIMSDEFKSIFKDAPDDKKETLEKAQQYLDEYVNDRPRIRIDTYLHAVTIENTNNYSVKDVEIVTKYFYDGYVYDTRNPEKVKKITSDERVHFASIDPGGKIAFFGMSPLSYSLGVNEVLILASGRKQYIIRSEDDIVSYFIPDGLVEWRGLIISIMIVMSIYGFSAIFFDSSMALLQRFYPKIRLAFVTKSEIKRTKALIELYDQERGGKEEDR